jgi:hypothetical protein
MAPDVRILQARDAALLDHVARDVFDGALDPQLVAEFLDDARHHLAVVRIGRR